MNNLIRRVRFFLDNMNWLPVIAVALAVITIAVAVELGNSFATIQALGLAAVAVAILSNKS